MPAKLELDTNELIRRYESGESAPKIAVAMGIGETSVYNYLKAAGVSRRYSGPELENMTMLRSAGCTRMGHRYQKSNAKRV